jgi:hypothetical protein
MFIELESERATEFQFLWKYLDFYKLIDFVQTNSIYFNRFDRFEDPLEGLNMNTMALKAFNKAFELTSDNITKSFSEEKQKKMLAD